MAKKQRKDRTSIVISVVIHALLIGGIAYWAIKTGKVAQLAEKILGVVRSEKKEAKPEPIQQKTQPPPSKLPPINQGIPEQTSSGTRRAVASDAPEATGDSFFQDNRKQGPGGSSTGTQAEAPKMVPQIKPPAPPPPKPYVPPLKPPAATTIKELFTERAKQAAATESFGAEQISKTGVSDAGAIVNKVAGANIVDGKFAVIRGLSDRYVTTTLNGAEIPSADPYRRSASLDLFPAQVISKVVIAKTFTPDQPGSYTGGGINIVTKAFPEKPFANISIGAAYNSQTTHNDHFLSYNGGGKDWLGFDDGSRALPSEITPETELPTFFRTTRPNDPEREQKFKDAERITELTRLLGPTQFAAEREAPPFNHNFSVGAGDTTYLFGKPFGIFAGLSYKHDYSFYENAVQERWRGLGQVGEFEQSKKFSDTRAISVVNWAGIVNLAYQLHDNHELGFNFLYNQNSEDLARYQQGTSTDNEAATFFLNRLHWTERNLNTFQLKGSHVLPEAGSIKFDWLAALSLTSQDEPDTRFFNYIEEGGTFEIGDPSTPDPKNPTRYFRDLDEQNRNVKADLTIPFRQWANMEAEARIGFFDSRSDRDFLDQEVVYKSDSIIFDGKPNGWLNNTNLGITTRTNLNASGRERFVTFDWNRYIELRDSDYTAEQAVRAGYAMVDFPLIERVRLIGGVRYEMTKIDVFSRSYLANRVTGETTNSSTIDKAHLLPAAGLIYNFWDDMYLRLSWSQTIARPSFRELAGYRSYDPLLDVLLDGNPNLTLSEIENYDIRWEWFPRPGEIFSVSLFYKDLKNAIERAFITTDGDIISFFNRPEAKVYGIEFEGRKNLDFVHRAFRYFSFGGNLSFLQSEAKLTSEELFNKREFVPDAEETRQLYDQAPYILNLDFNFDHPRSGTSASLVYNISGSRIAVANLNDLDIFEEPAPSLDFIIGQKLTKHMAVKFTVRNLLNPKIKRTYGEGGTRKFSSFQRGLTFGVSLSYDF